MSSMANRGWRQGEQGFARAATMGRSTLPTIGCTAQLTRPEHPYGADRAAGETLHVERQVAHDFGAGGSQSPGSRRAHREGMPSTRLKRTAASNPARAANGIGTLRWMIRMAIV